MKRLLTLVLSLGLVAAASAHAPEGVVHQAFQWPAGTEPTLDGDLSEWAIVPDDYRIPFSICLDGEGNPPTDFSDLNSEVIVGWSESENKLYVMDQRFDDFYDRDGVGGGAGGDDTIEMHHDGDHGGEPFWVSGDDFPDADERALNMGRYAQTYHTRFPDLPGSTGEGGETWAWFWVSQSTWHDQPEYMDWGFQIDGQLNSGEATVFIEFNRVMWDEFVWNDPDASVQTDLQEESIIGLGWMFGDQDGSGTNEEKPPVETWFMSGAADAWKTSASASDFLLAPVDPRVDFETAVEEESWGRIKEAFVE